LNLEAGTFEVPSVEIWTTDNTVIDNLTQVLATDLANLRELVEFEPGLRFAVLKIKELLMT
jgi:hypothetical protein